MVTKKQIKWNFLMVTENAWYYFCQTKNEGGL